MQFRTENFISESLSKREKIRKEKKNAVKITINISSLPHTLFFFFLFGDLKCPV